MGAVDDAPSAELPEELRQYSGPPDDRKEKLAFRKKVADTQRALLRSRWVGGWAAGWPAGGAGSRAGG